MKRLFVPVTLLCLCLSAYAFAQTSNATVGGTVSDSTGALIPGVTLTATNTATGIVNTVISNEAGAANRFPQGRYPAGSAQTAPAGTRRRSS